MNTPTPLPPTTARHRRVPWGLLLVLALVWAGSQWWQRSERAALGEAMRQANPADRIVVYTTATCHYCDRAKDWLQRERIPFKECRVDQPGPCAEAFARMGQPGTPVVQVDADRFQLGFDPAWLVKALTQPPGR